MSRLELIIQLLKIAFGIYFAYMVWLIYNSLKSFE